MFRNWLFHLVIVLSSLCAGIVLMLRGRFRTHRPQDNDDEEVYGYLSETDPSEVETEQEEDISREKHNNNEKDINE